VDHLTGLGANVVIMGEREIALAMIEEWKRRNAASPDTSSAA
jgi:CPA2 family monovalent cation:H+ antiporter-2